MELVEKKVCGYEVERQGEDTILRINCDGCTLAPSLEDSPECMARTIDKLIHIKNISKIVFFQKRDYEYDYSQTMMLMDVANLFSRIVRQGLLKNQPPGDEINDKLSHLQHLVFYTLKSDPLAAYVEIKRLYRREKMALPGMDQQHARTQQKFITILNYVIKGFEETKLIAIAQPYLSGYKVGERDAYRKIFSPSIKPDFMYTKLLASYPTEGDEIDNYTINGTEVTIFSLGNDSRYLYHIMPPEFKLDEDRYELLDTARRILAEHKPKRSEFVDPERMRQVFSNVSADLLDELAEQRQIRLTDKEFDELREILVRYTVGFGLIEVLLSDPGVQDISINSPMGRIPIFIVHGEYGDCMTNIVPTHTEAESWASKLRMISGRPLDEANPLLDSSLELPQASIRVSTITEPLNPSGLAFSFRRHRSKPWTLPLFIRNNMISPLAAGVLSFLIDGTRTLLIAGTRGSGKSSFLSALLIEIMRRYRIITIEDTLELPTKAMRDLGFNIQPMKVASALSRSSSEMGADDGIRSTLRLGDSALIVGEVRSTEAKALYEAMRVGAAANTVAGTIHGDSPYGIYDRVVNDIGVPKTSFKATDVCIVANPVRSADGIHKFRRITEITEVRKHWVDDPFTEGGFVDLLKYNSTNDTVEPTADLINGDSEIIKAVAGNISELAGNWDAVWENITLRGRIKEEQVKAAKEAEREELLEAEFTIRCNDQFHVLSDRIKQESGFLDYELLFTEWKNWLRRAVKEIELK
ncbi:MAG: type II/IV secretion system ATPase subunit [Candidatus Woesearchaeota archaeon]